MIKIFFLLVLSTVVTHAQSIKLSHTKRAKEIVLTKGMRVVYTPKVGVTRTGKLNEITSTYMVVDDVSIAYEDLKKMGRRKSGSGFGSFVMACLGGGLVGSVIFADNSSDPCPQCQTVYVENEGAGTAGNILAVTGGIGLMALSINSSIKNSARDLAVWKLEVID